MNASLPPADQTAVRRKRALRTAWLVAAIALLVYIGFISYGVIGS